MIIRDCDSFNEASKIITWVVGRESLNGIGAVAGAGGGAGGGAAGGGGIGGEGKGKFGANIQLEAALEGDSSLLIASLCFPAVIRIVLPPATVFYSRYLD